LPDPVGQFLFGTIRIDATQRLKRGIGIFEHQPTTGFQGRDHVLERTFPFRNVDQYKSSVYQVKQFIRRWILRNVMSAHVDVVGGGFFRPGSINVGSQNAASSSNAFCNRPCQGGTSSPDLPAPPARGYAASIELSQ